jgi:hypothetical protein
MNCLLRPGPNEGDLVARPATGRLDGRAREEGAAEVRAAPRLGPVYMQQLEAGRAVTHSSTERASWHS